MHAHTHTQVISFIKANYCVGVHRRCLIDISLTLPLAPLHLLAGEKIRHLSFIQEFADNTGFPAWLSSNVALERAETDNCLCHSKEKNDLKRIYLFLI